MTVKSGTFILNTVSNTTYSYCQVSIPNLYKRVTAKLYALNRLDGMMTALHFFSITAITFFSLHRFFKIKIYAIRCRLPEL